MTKIDQIIVATSSNQINKMGRNKKTTIDQDRHTHILNLFTIVVRSSRSLIKIKIIK